MWKSVTGLTLAITQSFTADGSVGYGRAVERSGAHVCRGRNKHAIGVSLVGGRGGCADDDFLDNFTPEQEEALRELIVEYSSKFPSIKEISGHNSYARKAFIDALALL